MEVLERGETGWAPGLPTTSRRRRPDLFPYFLALPSILVLVTFISYPVLFSVVISFFDYTFLRLSRPFVALANYARIIEEGRFLASFLLSLRWTVTNLILMSILGFVTALLLRSTFTGSGVLKVVLLVPWVLPQIVTGFIWGLMLTQDIGIINAALHTLGLVPRDFSWFQTGPMALRAVVIANTWRGFPFFALMLYAKLQTIPQELLEAASIDGASSVQVFRHIMVHFVKPVYQVCLVLGFLWTFNAYDIIAVMTSGGPLDQTRTLPLLVQREAFQYLQISRASTMSVMMFVAVAAMGLIVLGASALYRRCADRA